MDVFTASLRNMWRYVGEYNMLALVYVTTSHYLVSVTNSLKIKIAS